MPQQRSITPLPRRSNINRSHLSYYGWSILLQSMQQLQRVIWQRKGTVLWQAWSRDEHSNRYVAHGPRKSRRSHHTYTQYEISPYDAVVVVGFTSERHSRTAASYRPLLLKYIPHCHGMYCPKGEWTGRQVYVGERQNVLPQNAHNCISRMSNTPTISVLTKKWRYT